MEESGDEATSSLRIHEIMVKDASKMSYDELVSWAEEEAQMQTPKRRSYAKAILESNPGSTVKVGVAVNPDDKIHFDRFYVCFKGLKEGWKLGCRKIIALDACFLKGPSVGEILTAIGRDVNNHIFPVAWAFVNVENKDNLSWFLDLLGDDLEMPIGNGLTLTSDQHKGLIEAVNEVMPYAEHRQCARHIYEGFRKVRHVIPTGGHLFEVRNGSEAFGVDEQHRTCTCGSWLVEDYVPDCFKKQAFHNTYHQYLTSVGGVTFWPDRSDMSRVLPPKPRTMSGHNKKGCKNATVVLPPKPTYKKGRPRKTPIVGSSLIDKDIDTPLVDEQFVQEQVVEEQASDFDVGGSSDVRGCNQFGMRRDGLDWEKMILVLILLRTQEWHKKPTKMQIMTPLQPLTRLNFSDNAFGSTQNSHYHKDAEHEPQAAEQEPQAVE
ncbi:pentatricopeptide repeat-containing protein [Tanacetum coccineum]